MLQTYRAQTSVSEEIAPHIYRFVFSLLEGKSLSFVPGQYLLLNIPNGTRQYSFSSSPQNPLIEIIVDISPMGEGSKYLSSLRVGDEVTFRAPMGVFTLRQTPAPKIFMATGTGIAPMKSMALSLAAQNFAARYHIIWGLRKREDAYFRHEFEELDKQNANFQFHFCFSQSEPQETHELSGYVDKGLRTLYPENIFLMDTEFYLCGRPETVDAIQKTLIKDFDIAPGHIFLEKFT